MCRLLRMSHAALQLTTQQLCKTSARALLELLRACYPAVGILVVLGRYCGGAVRKYSPRIGISMSRQYHKMSSAASSPPACRTVRKPRTQAPRCDCFVSLLLAVCCLRCGRLQTLLLPACGSKHCTALFETSCQYPGAVCRRWRRNSRLHARIVPYPGHSGARHRSASTPVLWRGHGVPAHRRHPPSSSEGHHDGGAPRYTVLSSYQLTS